MGPLEQRHGTARRPERPVARPRPEGLDDATVEALGALSAALEVVEHARGLLYGFHRMSGQADLNLQDAVRQLRDAGHTALADDIDRTLVGRDTILDAWTFQLVEAFDEQYWSVFRDVVEHARGQFDAPRHTYEAEMKHAEQQSGTPDEDETEN